MGKKSGAEERSRSMESGCSEHNYETPKLLQKSPKASPPQVDRKKKPDSRKKARSDQEDGYEPVGKAPLNMETWIAEKNNEFNAIMVSDADTRNINKKASKESKVATVPHVNLEEVAVGNKNNEMENVELVHLQRSLSEKSFKSNSSEKNSAKQKKKIKEEEKEKERLAKQEEKRKRKEEKKMEEKEKKKKEEAEIKKLQKQEEEKLRQRHEEEKKKKVEAEKREKQEKEQRMEEERRAKLEKERMERQKKQEE